MAVATKAQYVALIKNLLPPGPAWPRDDETSPLAVVIEEIADLCAALDRQACELVEESDPETCAQSFLSWENDWGLPDECVTAFSEEEQTMSSRRNLLVFKASLQGGQSAAFFESVALLFGRRVTVEDMRVDDEPATFHKWRVIVSDPGGFADDGVLSAMGSGDATVDEGLLADIGSVPEQELDQGSISTAKKGQSDEATVQMGVDEPLASWGDSLLECVIRRLRPAHTTVYFAYP